MLCLGPIIHFWADDLTFLSVVVNREFVLPEIAAYDCRGHSATDLVLATSPSEALSWRHWYLCVHFFCADRFHVGFSMT